MDGFAQPGEDTQVKDTATKERDSGVNTTALEREMDRLVYKLYDLTPDEIKLVEEGAQR